MNETQEPPSNNEDGPIASRTRKLNRNRLPTNSNISNTAELDATTTQSPGEAITTEELVSIIEKDQDSRTDVENNILIEWAFLIPVAESLIRRKLAKVALAKRMRELADSDDAIKDKVDTLSKLIRYANHIVIYTGAGISTSASIPDYRGPNGLWTQRRKTGAYSMTRVHDLSRAEPTYTHMAISQLVSCGLVKHVVSQNCDGLHLRSGVPQDQLSEIHGNMYIEVCPTCEKQYIRQADVTRKTSRFRHKTGRKCHNCKEPNDNLIDTIVLYGERSRTRLPMNWERARSAAANADLIICIGSSLMTLRRYACLWPRTRNRTNGRESKLAIINLQHTPKDKQAVLKINGFCDHVMEMLMTRLDMDVPGYDWHADPLYFCATPFNPLELLNLNGNLIFEDRDQDDSDNEPPELENDCQVGNPRLTAEFDRLENYESEVPTETNCPPVTATPGRPQAGAAAGLKVATSADANNTCALPKWLSHNLGTSTGKRYYRRKRHGNRGRTKNRPPITIDTEDDANDN